MTAEAIQEQNETSSLYAAQEMSEWFSDYVFGFTDEIGELPDTTKQRLARQFGAMSDSEQFTKLRDMILQAEEEHQSGLALYICGYPDDALDVLIDEGASGIREVIDRYIAPVDAPQALARVIALDTKENPDKPIQRASRTRQLGGQTVRSAKRNIEGRDAVGLYLEEIAKNPLLDAVQEVELGKTIEAGLMAEKLLSDDTLNIENGGAPGEATREELEWLAEQGKQAVDTFITSNLRLVVSIARKYGRAQMPMLDLIQEGNTGLMHAVEKFDYTKGYKFSTYATWWIRQAITRGIAQQSRIIRLPVHINEDLNKVLGARRNLERLLGHDPDPDEIAEELGITVERVNDLLTWSKEHVSLDMPLDEDGDTTFGDLVARDTTPGPENAVIDQHMHDQLLQLVSQLDERSADIIRLRYGLIDGRQYKLADIGRRIGVSAERVRQLEREALGALQTLAQGGQIESKSGHQPVPVTQQLGKRALLKLELTEKLSAVGEGLSERDREIIRTYIESPSHIAAGEKLRVSGGTFSTHYQAAKSRLDALTMG